MTEKKTPQRKCLGCNQMKDKQILVRVVRNADGTVSVDLTGKMPGRGAYICKNEKCLNTALKSHRLDRSLKCHIQDELSDTLREQLKDSN